jgi:adenylate cyclase
VSDEPVERRLAAILVADVAGYSRLIGEDEIGTLSRLKNHRRELIDPKIAEHKGHIVKTTGDGLLIEFSSVVEAVACAVAVQRGMVARNASTPEHQYIHFRMGLNLGDVIVDEGDIYGDGVNVAARLEALADPGGICVSALVHDHVQDRADWSFEDLGEQRLKNIVRLVRVYRVLLDPSAVVPRAPLPVPEKPSIAVLPFQNMGGDPEEEYIADGISEDIITLLSKSRGLFVIARNSTFTYKGRSVDVKSVGRELGVRYVLEGSVRKAGNRIRVTAQLIEAASSSHLWAERYDRELTDIFAVQDEITAVVSNTILPTVERSERERASRKPPESLDAWECYQRGLWHFFKCEPQENLRGREFFQRAIRHDPGLGLAYCGLSLTYLLEAWFFPHASRPETVLLAVENARTSLSLDPLNATAHAVLGCGLIMLGRHDEGIEEADASISLDANHAWGYGIKGMSRLYAGQPCDAIEPLQTAMRLSPFDPISPIWLFWLGRAHYQVRDYHAAMIVSRRLYEARPDLPPNIRTLIAALGQIDLIDEAQRIIREAKTRLGEHAIMHAPRDQVAESRPEQYEHLLEGLQKAGLVRRVVLSDLERDLRAKLP